MIKRWLFCLIFVTNSAFSQALMTKVVTLTYIPADTAIQLIQPILQAGEKISGNGQTLVLNVSPQTLTQIRTVLHQVDVAPVTFNVSVYQGDPNFLSKQNSNSVVYSTQSPAEEQRSQSVQVMSGQSAYVSTGEEVPIVNAVGVGFFTGVSYQQHNIKNGLLVQPMLQGSQVKLTVKRMREQVNAAGGPQFDNQTVDTTIMAPLNKWVSLGSPEGTQADNSNDTSYSAGRSFSQNSTLYIKVTVVKAVPVTQDSSNDPTF